MLENGIKKATLSLNRVFQELNSKKFTFNIKKKKTILWLSPSTTQ